MEKRSMIIFQIPFCDKRCCPVCDGELKLYRPYRIFVRYTTRGREVIGAHLKYCGACDSFFADQQAVATIRLREGMDPVIFEAGHDRDDNLKKAKSIPEWKLTRMKYQKSLNPYAPKRIVCNDDVGERCPQCGFRLRIMETGIPVGDEKHWRIHGKGCARCGYLFIEDGSRRKTREIINGSPAGEHFLLDEESIYDCRRIKRAGEMRFAEQDKRRQES